MSVESIGAASGEFNTGTEITSESGFVTDVDVSFGSGVDSTTVSVSPSSVPSAVNAPTPIVVEEEEPATTVEMDASSSASSAEESSSFSVKLETDGLISSLEEKYYSQENINSFKEEHSTWVRFSGYRSRSSSIFNRDDSNYKDNTSHPWSRSSSSDSTNKIDYNEVDNSMITLASISKTGSEEDIAEFKKIDIDGDGCLSNLEMSLTDETREAYQADKTEQTENIASFKEKHSTWVKSSFFGTDRMVTLTEISKTGSEEDIAEFKNIDLDGDGCLSDFEMGLSDSDREVYKTNAKQAESDLASFKETHGDWVKDESSIYKIFNPNNNDMITLTELSKTGSEEDIAEFKNIDLDGDGCLSDKEMITASRTGERETFYNNHTDLVNEDGSYINRDKAVEKGLEAVFDAIDTNGDGEITYDEVLDTNESDT